MNLARRISEKGRVERAAEELRMSMIRMFQSIEKDFVGKPLHQDTMESFNRRLMESLQSYRPPVVDTAVMPSLTERYGLPNEILETVNRVHFDITINP